LKNENVMTEEFTDNFLDMLCDLVNKLIVKDFRQKSFSYRLECKGEIASHILNDKSLSITDSVNIEIYWPKKDVEYCNCYLTLNDRNNYSLLYLARFFEMGGIKMLTNRIRVV